MLEKISGLREKVPDLSELPGAGIIAVAAKEINLIKTQKIALALILLYPLIVIGTLGLAFSGSFDLGAIDVAFYAPKNISGFDTANFISKLEQTGRVNLLMMEKEGDVEKAIRESKAKIGLVIHEPEITHGRYVVDLKMDNSQIVGSEFFFTVANDSIRRVGFDTSKEFLVDIWSNLSQIKNDLKGETRRVDSFILQLEESERELLDLNESINEIDVAEMREKLGKQEDIIREIDPKIESFNDKINAFSGSEQGFLERIQESRRKIPGYRADIQQSRDDLQEANDYCIENYDIISQDPTIREGCDKIINSYATLGDAEEDLGKADAELESTEQELIAVDAELKEAGADLSDIKERLKDTNTDLNYFNTQLSNLGTTVDNINGLIVSALENKRTTQQDLEESKGLMNSFIDKLDDLQGLDPQFLANPIIINKISVYSLNKIDIVTPIAVVLVLLLTTMLLTGVSFVVERSQGAYARLKLSTTSKVKIFAGKVLGQLIFALMETIILLGVAILVFKVQISGNILDLGIAISVVSVSFITLGLFISNYTRIQSTTILAGLLLVIPMIFISGIVLPIELMSQIIQGASSIPPLTGGISLVTEVMLKGTSITLLGGDILNLLVPALVFFGFTLANRNL